MGFASISGPTPQSARSRSSSRERVFFCGRRTRSARSRSFSRERAIGRERPPRASPPTVRVAGPPGKPNPAHGRSQLTSSPSPDGCRDLYSASAARLWSRCQSLRHRGPQNLLHGRLPWGRSRPHRWHRLTSEPIRAPPLYRVMRYTGSVRSRGGWCQEKKPAPAMHRGGLGGRRGGGHLRTQRGAPGVPGGRAPGYDWTCRW